MYFSGCIFLGVFSEFRLLLVVEGVVIHVDIDVGVGKPPTSLNST